MLPWVYSEIGHRRRQNIVKTSATRSPAARVPFCFYHIFDVICYLLLNWRRNTSCSCTLETLSMKPCQQSLSFACSISAYSRKTTWSMRCLLLGYSFEPRPNSRALGTAGSVMSIGLLVNGCSHSKKPVWQEKTRLTSPQVQTAVTSKVWRDSGRASFSPSHSRRQKEDLFAWWVKNCFRVVVVVAVAFLSFICFLTISFKRYL